MDRIILQLGIVVEGWSSVHPEKGSSQDGQESTGTTKDSRHVTPLLTVLCMCGLMNVSHHPGRWMMIRALSS